MASGPSGLGPDSGGVGAVPVGRATGLGSFDREPGGANGDVLNGSEDGDKKTSASVADAIAVVFPPSPMNPNDDPSLVPTDANEIRSWYLYDCASSPVAATVVTFWAMLVTGYAKARAATQHSVVEWRENFAGGSLCFGRCVLAVVDATTGAVATTTSSECGAYDSAIPQFASMKFQRPDDMASNCEWFPVSPNIPGSGLDFGAVVVYCNFVSQLACGAFLVIFGSLGDFGGFRKKGLVVGWFLFSVCPLIAGATSPGDLGGGDTNQMRRALQITASLFVVTNIAHLAAQQMFDAYLPLLAQTHPRVQQVLGMIPGTETETKKKDDSRWEKAKDKCWRCWGTTSHLNALSAGGKGLEQLTLQQYRRDDIGWAEKYEGYEGQSEETEKRDDDDANAALVAAVTKARQSSGSELALRAPTLGFLSMLFVVSIQLVCILRAGVGDWSTGLRLSLLAVGAWGAAVGLLGLRGIRVRPGAPLFSSGGGTDTKGGDETETKGTGLSDTNKDEKDTKDNYSTDKHKDTKNTRENTLSDKHKGNAEKDTKGKDLGNTLGDTREGGTVRRNHGACFETSSSENRRDNTKGALRTVASLGLRRTVLSAKMLRKNHPQLLKLLVGQVLSTITNGTMLSSYTLYAQRELGATATDLVVLMFAASIAALVSTASFSRIATRLTEKQLKWTLVSLKACTLMWPVWACFGFKRKYEMILLPLVASPINANILPTLRSIFQQATPRGYEASLFSLCGVCTVAFTWIGSLIVGGFLALTGSMRWGLLAIDVFVACSLPFFASFDPEQARADRRRIELGDFHDPEGTFSELKN